MHQTHVPPLINIQVLEEEGDELSDIVSAPRMVVTQFVRHHMPISSNVNLSKAQLDSLVVQVRQLGMAPMHERGK